MLVRLNEFACCSRTDSPFTHQRSRQRIVASFGLGRAPRFALRRAVIARREMRPNQLLPPNTFSTTSTRASWIPDFESRDFRLVLTGETSVSRRPIRFGGPCDFVSWGGVFFPDFPRCLSRGHPGHESLDRTSDISVASPSLIDGAFATHRSSSGSPRLHSPCVREDHTLSTIRDAFHRQVIASSGLTPSLVDLATLPPRLDSRRCFARPFPRSRCPQVSPWTTDW
jgi:hypothetical protein